MNYLFVFWGVAILFYIIYFSARILKIKLMIDFFEDVGTLIIIVLLFFAIMAIITNDPILGIEIPVQLQWLGSLLLSGFGGWQFYLRPLKNKVFSMDRELGEIKTSVSNVGKNVDKLLDRGIKE